MFNEIPHFCFNFYSNWDPAYVRDVCEYFAGVFNVRMNSGANDSILLIDDRELIQMFHIKNKVALAVPSCASLDS